MVVAQGPTVDENIIGSRLTKNWVEKAYQALSRAERALGQTKFTQAGFELNEAEFLLDISLELALPKDHLAAKHIREQVDKMRGQIKEWGGDEEAQHVAEAWWDRVFSHHLREVAFPAWESMRENKPLTHEQIYYLPRYFSRVLMPEIEEFKKKYPDPNALADVVRLAGGTLGDGWAFCPGDWRDKPRVAGTLEIIAQVNEKLPAYIAQSIPAAVSFAKKKLLEQGGDIVPFLLIQALDASKIVLSLQPDNAMAEKVRARAQDQFRQYREKVGFDVSKVRMPQDVSPNDAALHADLKAAYERWASKRGYQETVRRVVVMSGWRESHDAWWEGNTLHWGTFRRIKGAVAVKKANGECMVVYLIFYRALLANGQWSGTAVEKVTYSEPILEQNIGG